MQRHAEGVAFQAIAGEYLCDPTRGLEPSVGTHPAGTVLPVEVYPSWINRELNFIRQICTAVKYHLNQGRTKTFGNFEGMTWNFRSFHDSGAKRWNSLFPLPDRFKSNCQAGTRLGQGRADRKVPWACAAVNPAATCFNEGLQPQLARFCPRLRSAQWKLEMRMTCRRRGVFRSLDKQSCGTACGLACPSRTRSSVHCTVVDKLPSMPFRG